ncbi:MAG: tRNA (adenosine(37)-N6)-threonylcarbamoyltransferase complex dimerization subunit type 1 TsaB [Magnetococcales bacterium]|nr:tRNA (adenosine(37)-N6)-threonylcarbamoyltransferase complex dimerization subunit type 1 TsaB [Magnetococcales bacterium]
MKILSIDTANREGHAALLDGESAVDQRHFQGPEGHMLHLPEAVTAMLAAAAWTPASLELIAVTIGPGAFTGLRIGLGFAKGLAMARHLPLIGISTLELMAATARLAATPPLSSARSLPSETLTPPLPTSLAVTQQPLLVTMDARRGDLFAALFQPDGLLLWSPQRWQPETLDARVAKLPGGVLRVDDGLCDPVTLGRLGLRHLRERGSDNPLTLEPLYLRRADAEKALSPPSDPA